MYFKDVFLQGRLSVFFFLRGREKSVVFHESFEKMNGTSEVQFMRTPLKKKKKKTNLKNVVVYNTFSHCSTHKKKGVFF